MKRATIAPILLVACATPRPDEPLPSSARIRVDNPSEVVTTAPLRYAVVWTTKQGARKGFVTTADGPLGDLPATVTAPLALPGNDTLRSLNPVDLLSLAPFVLVGAYRPRIVVYGDVNDDGHFDPGVLGGTGPDTVIGVDDELDALPTAILNLEGSLQLLTLREQEAFYARNGGRFSPFVWADFTGSGLSLADTSQVSIALPESNVAATDLDCLRNVSRLYAGITLGSGNTLRAPTHALVDTSLDAAAVCGATITDCAAADFAALEPPSFEEDTKGDHQRLLQCRSNAAMEFLLILEAEIRCEICTCRREARTELFITTPGARPAWWPCGTNVAYCESAAPATDFDLTCLLNGDAGTGDAGTGDAGRTDASGQ